MGYGVGNNGQQQTNGKRKCIETSTTVTKPVTNRTQAAGNVYAGVANVTRVNVVGGVGSGVVREEP